MHTPMPCAHMHARAPGPDLPLHYAGLMLSESSTGRKMPEAGVRLHHVPFLLGGRQTSVR